MNNQDLVDKLQKKIIKLEKQLEMAERIISQVPAHIYWLDKNFVFQGCNQAQADSAGLKSPKEIIGTKVEDYQTPERCKILHANNVKVLAEQRTLIVEEPGKSHNATTTTVYLSCKSPLYDNQHNVIGIIGTSVDITQLKEKEREIERAKEEAEITLSHIISLMPGHVYWQNREGILLGCNMRQAEALGLDNLDDILGKTVYDLLPPEQATKIDVINSQVMAEDIIITAEEPATFVDGTEKLFLSQKAPIKNKAGKIIGCIGISFDITDRKQAERELNQAKEKAETANVLKSEFIANISHDIRTPLHSVLGLAELLQMKEHTAAQEDIIQALVQSSKTLLTLVEDILNFAKIEAKLAKNEFKFDLQKEIHNVIETVSNSANKKNLTITVEYDKSIPKKIINDNTLINRILLNLLSNAIKFTEKGSIKVSVACIKKSLKECRLKISVEDTGIGIPKDKIPFIFDRFYRVKPSYESEYKGTGLGLAIVKQLAESLHAELETISELNKGSYFSFTFNSKIDYQDKTDHKKKGATIALDKNKHYHVLLVEDDVIAQKYTSATLHNLNCTIDIAKTGKEALAMATHDYDLILMDIGLPDMSGLDVAKKIRKILKKPTIIIALTAHGKGFGLDDDLLSVMDDFLQKPAGYQDFLSILNNLETCITKK